MTCSRSREPLPERTENLGQTIIGNIMSGLRQGNRPPLLAEDGATFWAHIEPLPGGQFRASCGATLNRGSYVGDEAPHHLLFDDRNQACSWVHQVGAARGFRKISWQ